MMGSTGVQHHDRGAAAVEFALVSVLLFTLLFAIIQYGFLFFQYQAAAATAHEAARLAADGIDDPVNGIPGSGCAVFSAAVLQRAEANGLPSGAVTGVSVHYPDPNNPNVQGNDLTPEHGMTAIVKVQWSPTTFRMPFVPFPGGALTVQAATTIEDVGTDLFPCGFGDLQ